LSDKETDDELIRLINHASEWGRKDIGEASENLLWAAAKAQRFKALNQLAKDSPKIDTENTEMVEENVLKLFDELGIDYEEEEK